jgi:LPXTG-motif cell wall-anchored protein
MKKTILMISISGILFLSGLSMAVAQDQPSATKDSVNADKAAKPVFYDTAAEEAPKGNSTTTYVLVIGAIVLVGAGGYFMMKKKNN